MSGRNDKCGTGTNGQMTSRPMVLADIGQKYQNWNPLTDETMVGRANLARGYASVQVVVDTGRAQYDQTVIVKSPSVVVIPFDRLGRLGIVRMSRPVGQCFEHEGVTPGLSYIRDIDEGGLWHEYCGALGTDLWWETPRGLVHGNGPDPLEIVRRAAASEAMEEGGFVLDPSSITLLAPRPINMDATWFPEGIWFVRATIDRFDEARPEASERIHESQLLTHDEYVAWVQNATITDAPTITGCALAGWAAA
ncbi:MAG: NUDIX hydrolase [Candidatus Doudnabacteria bacterium]|nr:NUDIX hydrolase [Candidatus Doudnabacteria bacterium]